MRVLCESKSCAYYMSQCIRNNITLSDGKCPYYSSEELTAFDIFHYPSFYTWDIVQGGETHTRYGHILEVASMFYKDPYVLIAPNLLLHEQHIHYSVRPKTYIDMHMYFRFMDSNIQPLYLEGLLYDYLGKEYQINKIDCNKQYVHVEGYQ